MSDMFIYVPEKKRKVIISESTKAVVEEVVEHFDELPEDEMVKKINESKKAVAKKTKKGISVKQSLNG